MIGSSGRAVRVCGGPAVQPAGKRPLHPLTLLRRGITPPNGQGTNTVRHDWIEDQPLHVGSAYQELPGRLRSGCGAARVPPRVTGGRCREKHEREYRAHATQQPR
jgi:hypothetical protein